MRKTVNNFDTLGPRPHSQEEWLDLQQIASVEVTSEVPNFPIESALSASEGPGWRAADPGEQIIRIVLDNPRPLRRIRLEFSETKIERTQEFALRWSQAGGPFSEIVRQQWNFSPHGSTSEVEDYKINLDSASALELRLKPDLALSSSALATLAAWRVA
jgi:hypothetical protein